MNAPILFSDQRVIVLRQISPRKRWFKYEDTLLVPDKWLAKKGLAIGNDLDSKDSIHHLGTQIPDSMWPVYVLKTPEEIDVFLNKSDWLNPPGGIAYRSEVDLKKISIGMNVGFASKKGYKKTHIILQTIPVEDKFALKPVVRDTELDEKILEKLNSDGLLCDTSGEFYLSGYTNYRQLENELILRSNGNYFKDITSSVKLLRS